MDLWAIIGRLAVIATLLTAVFKVIAWWRAPRGKLTANVLPSRFVLPPSIEEEFKASADRIRDVVETFLKDYPKKENDYDEAYHRSKRLADQIAFAAKDRLSYENRSFQGCWHARIENFGKMRCSGVNIHLPHATLARVQRDSDREPAVMPVNGLVTIGELRPRGHCYVTAWTDERVKDRDNFDVVLTHDSGIGRVNGRWETSRVGWILGTLARRDNLVSLLVPIFFAVLAVIIISYGLIPLLSKTPRGAPASRVQPVPSPTPTHP